MRTDKFFKEVCSKINEIDELLRVTISWSRVMQLNPDTTINGENGDSISEKWESVAKGVDDLVEDIAALKQEELLQVADMIAELRKEIRIIEKRMDKHTKAFDIYIERETSHERRVQRCQIHDYWAFIYRDMRLVVDALSGTLRSINDAAPQPAEEEPLHPTANDETPILHSFIGKEADKYLRFCKEEKYQGRKGLQLVLKDSKRVRLLKYIGKTNDVGIWLSNKGYKLYELHEELTRAGAIKCDESNFNHSFSSKVEDVLKKAWDSYN